MPSATITRATITSRSVKPRQRRGALAFIEAFLADLERAVEVADEDHAAAGEVAIERGLERRHLAAGEQNHLRLRRIVLVVARSEEHTSELQSRENLVCRLLLEKKKKK